MRDPKVERIRRARQGWQNKKTGRESVLELLRISRRTANERYVSEAAGFWLSRLAPSEQRASA